MSFSRLVTPVLNKHGWETRPGLGIGLCQLWECHTKMCMSHLTGSKSPPSTCGHWEHLSIHHTHTFGANSSSFYWPVENVHSGGAQGSPRAPWLCQSPFCHGHQAAPHPLLCLPEGRAQPPASLNGQSHVQEAGTNNQQLDFHSTESNTPRKWNLTVQNAWEHSASKVLNMGASFPPKMGWISLETTTGHQIL